MTLLDGQLGPELSVDAREGGGGKMRQRLKSHRGKIVMAEEKLIHSLPFSFYLASFCFAKLSGELTSSKSSDPE